MKAPQTGGKRGRKPKVTRTLKIEVHPKAYEWFEVLHAKGYFGVSVEDVVANLLNVRLEQLLEKGDIVETPVLGSAIPFPTQANKNTPPNKTAVPQ